MRRWQLLGCGLVGAGGLIFGPTGAERVRAAGYFNMPCTMMQMAGHGYGGGYHAPLLLGPHKFDGWGPPNEVRLPYAPRPWCGCASYDNYEQTGAAPGVMEGNVPTSVAPSAAEKIPTPAVDRDAPSSMDVAPRTESRPIFDPPVQP